MKTEVAENPPAIPNSEPVVAAKAAGLRYVTDDKPGIRRERHGDSFIFIGKDGDAVDDETTLARIKALVIPPAWTDVWICPSPNGHLQATGRDAKGRKQYRYHAKWRTVRDEVKYERMLNFGQALPAIRKAVDEALQLPGLPREKVLATIVRLLEVTMMRIGNEEYARTNKSFGLTTLRSRHVKVDGKEIDFNFRGKSGVFHTIHLEDRRLAKIIAKTRELPGQDLFQYVDEDGEPHTVDSGDVNDYLRTITGEDYTAKDFRTWSGTLLAALALHEFEKFDSEAQAKKNIVRAIESVAERLGNTPTICRKCYVHPAVIDAYLEGTVLDALRTETTRQLVDDLHSLSPEEAAVLTLLQQRLQKAAEKQAPPAARAKQAKKAPAAPRSARGSAPRSARRSTTADKSKEAARAA